MFWIASDAWRVSLCSRSLFIADILWNYIQYFLGSLCLSHQNYTFVMIKFGCLVYLVALLVGCLGGSVTKFDLAGKATKRVNSGFGLKVMVGGYLFVSGPCTLQLSCGTIYKLS